MFLRKALKLFTQWLFIVEQNKLTTLAIILDHIQGLFWKIRSCVRFNLKRARKCSKRAQLWIFTPHSSKFRAFRTLHLPIRHVFLEFLVENKAYHFSKRALRAGTARNKLLKKALIF